ncbi:hypothetical protein OSTOST_13686, partial [Ostertagia ostertagi]
TVFIDHAARRTTLIDPRLPAPTVDRKRGRSAPPARRQNWTKTGTYWIWRAVPAEIALLVEERLPELAPKIRKKLRLIERLGAVALARLANDVDLITAIRFRFSRSNLLQDAFDQILAADPVTLRRARLSIAFDDEEG